MLDFTLHQQDASGARNGTVTVRGRRFETPAFMPVATQGSIKALTQAEVVGLGAQIVLGNAYHLYLRPGIGLLREADQVASCRASRTARLASTASRTASWVSSSVGVGASPGYRDATA